MPSLFSKNNTFRSLIASIPVENHAIEVNREFWKQHFEKAGCQKIHADIFGEAQTIWLSRGAILNSTPSPQKCVEILFWGYPSGMRGSQHEKFLANLQRIADASAGTKKDWQSYFEVFKEIKNLGISTITKLAYFHNAQFEKYPALILDDRIINLLQAGIWNELEGFKDIKRDKASGMYLDYLKTMTEIAAQMCVQPAQLEFFLFSLGGSFVDLESTPRPQLKPK
jgi:hypothetical protein